MYQEREFKVGGLTLRGRHYAADLEAENTANTGTRKLIALHGWLDNCASFARLAPLLLEQNCEILALDLPGHGQSDHRNHSGAYNIWQDIPDILQIADQLEWQKFGLIAHSRGAMIATLSAALCPQRINFLGLIDGVAPVPIKEDETFEQMQRAIEGALAIRDKQRSTYSSFASAVKAREQGFTALDHEDALMLAERGVKQDGDVWYWASDKKLLIPSEIKFTQKQLEEYLLKLQIDLNVVLANNGLITDFAFLVDWLKGFSRVKITMVDGGHHLHMHQSAEAVAEVFAKVLPPAHDA